MAAPASTPLARALDPARVLLATPPLDRERVLRDLARLVMADQPAAVADAFVTAIIEREAVAPTALGRGFALPHARMPGLPACRIGLGLVPAGLDCDASDGLPVKVIVMMASREADHVEHLRNMAALAQRLRRPGLIERVAAATPAEAIALLCAD